MNPLTITVLTCSLLLGACASTAETAGRDQLTANVGIYAPPIPGAATVRIGVPAFKVADGVEAKVSPLAADQIVSLAANSQRFEVIERAQLGQLLQEQNLEGIVTAGELSKPAQVRGVEWLLLGKVTSLRVKQSQTGSSFSLGSVPVPGTYGALGLFGIDNKDVVLKVECGVDLRLVDPTTGQTVVADFSEFDRTDKASSMGLQILGGNVDSNAVVQLGEDDQGRILRLALDDCLRKMLPKVDRLLQQRGKQDVAGAKPTGAIDGTDSAMPKQAQFCSGCGQRLLPGAKFCAGCGQPAK